MCQPNRTQSDVNKRRSRVDEGIFWKFILRSGASEAGNDEVYKEKWRLVFQTALLIATMMIPFSAALVMKESAQVKQYFSRTFSYKVPSSGKK